MNKYDYEKIDWSKCPSIEKSPDTENTNRHIMDVELPENECKNSCLQAIKVSRILII